MKILNSENFKSATSELVGFSAPSNGMYFPLTKKINNSIVSVGGDLSVKVFRNHLAPVGEEKEIFVGALSADTINTALALCI